MAKSKKRRRSGIIRQLIFTVGLLICLYPLVTRAVNYLQLQQQTAQLKADAAAQAKRAKKLAAQQGQQISLDSYGTSRAQKQLGKNLLGSIAIPSINVLLPMFDNVSDNVLNHGAGVIPGTSAPIGGKGTHTAISAHSGMPTKTLFSNLKKVKRGDVFILTVAGKHRAYKVDRIQTVLPTEAEALKVQAGRDLATLVTCTPVPANTHRLLVTGHRVPYTKAVANSAKKAQHQETWRNIVILAGIFWGLVTLIAHQVWRWQNREKQSRAKRLEDED